MISPNGVSIIFCLIYGIDKFDLFIFYRKLGTPV